MLSLFDSYDKLYYGRIGWSIFLDVTLSSLIDF
jgi:hypothetical protein